MAPKRKHAATVEKNGSNDAESSHDDATVAVESNGADGEDDTTTADPPTKRTRSTKTDTPNGSAGHKRTTSISSTKKYRGENGEAGTMRMEAPPPAGAVDPAGYKTNSPPEGRPVRVYADGVFDMFHLGHMRVLQQAKTAFPNVHLLVGVTGDIETHKRKGLTVMSAKERAESVRHCRWVDEVIEDCPWIIDVDFMDKHAIDYVAHDDLPYGASEGDDIYKPIKEQGKFLVTQRTEGVSTTGIITKIVRDYEQYISRQLRRGTSRQELNVSWLKKNELDLKRHVTDLRDTIRTNWTTTGQELSRDLKQFWSSRPSSPAPSSRSTNPGSASRPSMTRTMSGALSPIFDVASGRSTRSGVAGTAAGPGGRNMDFAAGYALGLIGSVRGWMKGSRRVNLSDSRAQSPHDGDESDGRSPLSPTSHDEEMEDDDELELELGRGRSGRSSSGRAAAGNLKTSSSSSSSEGKAGSAKSVRIQRREGEKMDLESPSKQLVQETRSGV